MANYTATNKVKAQIALNGEMAKADTRFRFPAVWNFLLSQSKGFLQNYETLRSAESRPIEAGYLKRSARSLTGARSHNHGGAHGDSGVITPSFATKADGFSMTLKQGDANTIGYQEQMNNEMVNVVANFAEGMDLLSSQTLFANRSGVNTATVNGSFNATNDVFEVAVADVARFPQMIKSVMEINKYKGAMLNFLCDTVAYQNFEFYGAQGNTNATNTSFQNGNINFIHDVSLNAQAIALSATYNKGFVNVVPNGMVGAITWIPIENRQGKETSVNKYGNLLNPVDGQLLALHSYETRLDGTSVNGQLQDVSTEFQLSNDVAIVIAPLSVATETPIMAFALI
jgi:hypothetical protein